MGQGPLQARLPEDAGHSGAQAVQHAVVRPPPQEALAAEDPGAQG